MNYRYRMHWFCDPEAPLNAGRPLFGRDAAEAIALAESLWKEGVYAAALGYLVVDTDEGTVVWRRQCDLAERKATGRRAQANAAPELCKP